MAGRPPINTVPFFPYYHKEGRAMRIINHKYGNDGFSTWIRILIEIARTNFHYVTLQDEESIMDLASVCKIDEEKLIEIIESLCKLGEFDADVWEKKKIIWSQKFIDNIQKAYEQRKSKPLTRNQFLDRVGLSDLKNQKSEKIEPKEVKLKPVKEGKGTTPKSYSDLTPSRFYKIEYLGEVYIKDERLLKAVSKTTHKSVKDIKAFIPDFIENLIGHGKSQETASEFAKYFKNWLKYQEKPTEAKTSKEPKLDWTLLDTNELTTLGYKEQMELIKKRMSA